MLSYLAAFGLALLAGLILTPAVRWLALHHGAIARSGSRHVHNGKIPRLGGIALVLGWATPLALFLPLAGFGAEVLAKARLELVGVLGGAVAICLLGAADDIRGLRVVHKLLGQCAVATLAYACGFRIDAISLPFVGTLPMGIFAGPITVLWIVGITNAVNLIDGLDGLAAGVSFFAALTGFVVAIINGSTLSTLVLAPLMGVLLAFLVFNFNPARIFMGDSGSYFLGYVLATTSLSGALQQKASTAVSLLVPMIALGLPIFDTLFSMLRRFLERRPIFAPDRGHVHHRLLELGLTHRRAVMLLYGVSVTFAACAITISLGRSLETGVALLAASTVMVVLVRVTGSFGSLLRAGRPGLRAYDATTERLRTDLPLMLRSMNEARNEHQILDVLKTAGDACGCELVEIRTDATSRTLDRKPARPGLHGRTSYPLGVENRARARLDLVWETTDQQFSPQAAILFQILIDAAAQALERCSSTLGPESDPPPASPAHSPALIGLPTSDRA